MHRPVPPPKRKGPPKRVEPKIPHKPKVAPAEAPRSGPVVPESLAEEPEFYYDGPSKSFFVRTSSGEFVEYSAEALKTRLRKAGFDHTGDEGQLSQIDDMIETARDVRFVRWAGPLGGFWAGRYVMNGAPVLVTQNPTIIEANPDYQDDMVHAYFERLLGEEQVTYFHVWMKLAREALLDKSLRKGPALIMVGKANHGKTLAGRLIKLMLGGRAQDPTQFAQGTSTFNSHLFGAEFLFADDQGGGRDDYHSRLQTAATIKQLVANDAPMCHAKGRTQVTLDVYWRVMFALNDEPEDLKVLPALSDGIMGKLIIFKTVDRAVTIKTETAAEYTAFRNKLEAAIPDYLGWLNDFEIPKEMLHGRFGQTVYHNQEVLDDLNSFAPETKLLQKIDDCGEEIWDQKLEAREIEAIVQAYNETGTRDLFRRPGSCGMLLARLARTGNRVTFAGRIKGGPQRYVVSNPNAGESSTSTKKGV
jgi:hypothetical protein